MINWYRPWDSLHCIFIQLGHKFRHDRPGRLDSLDITYVQCERCGLMRRVD